MRRAVVVVYAPLRVASAAERIARDAASLANGPCSVETLVVPVPDPEFQAEVISEGAPECGLPVAELVQAMLWALEGLGLLAPSIPSLHGEESLIHITV